MASSVCIPTDTATLAEAMGGGLAVWNAGGWIHKGAMIPGRKLTGRELVTVVGTTAGAKVMSDQTWIVDRFGALGARQIKRLVELTRGRR